MKEVGLAVFALVIALAAISANSASLLPYILPVTLANGKEELMDPLIAQEVVVD